MRERERERKGGRREREQQTVERCVSAQVTHEAEEEATQHTVPISSPLHSRRGRARHSGMEGRDREMGGGVEER